jgi:hypothetical protein
MILRPGNGRDQDHRLKETAEKYKEQIQGGKPEVNFWGKHQTF